MEAYRRYLFGEFELDPQIHRLSREGAPVHLSKKPFNLLLYLIEHRDRLVSRRELLEHFWDGHDVYEETLTKCVGAIRKAFGDTAETPRFIETHWAEGYRFVCPVEEIAPELLIERTRGVKIVVDETDEPAISGSPAITAKTSAFPRLAIPVALFSVAVVAIGFGLWIGGRAAGNSEIRSIAVLPLRNLTDDASNDFLSDGISESLITLLSQTKGLKVIARGSSFRYEGDVDPIDIGRKLNVESILVGALRGSNGSLRISTRLLSTRDGSVLWASETSDRPANDILVLQDDIARNVSAGFRQRTEGGSVAAKHHTDNFEAYQNYLKGRFFWNRRTPESLKKGLEYFQRAAELDPGFSLAYSGMADSYQLLAEYRGMKTSEAFALARSAALKAVELDDSSAEAHNALAYTLAFYDWEWNHAEREFLRAIELNPNYASAHQWYSELLTTLARFDEAEREIMIASQCDPLSLVVMTDIASVYYMTRRQDLTIEQANRVLEMEPNFAWGHLYLWVAYEQKGMEAESVSAYATAMQQTWGSKQADELRTAYATGGKNAFWTKYLAEVSDPNQSNFRLAWDRILCYLRLGDRDQTFAWLEKSYAERDRWIMNIRLDPQFDSIRSDPRYPELVRRIGLEP